MNEFLELISDQTVNDFIAVVAAKYKFASFIILAILDEVLARLPVKYQGIIRSLWARFKNGRGL